MKARFLKYCLSIAALLFVAFTCFPNNAQLLHFGKESTQVDSSYLHPYKKGTSHFVLKKVKENTFHKQSIQRTLVSHSKGSCPETQFEAQNTLTLKKAKALFKFELLRFAQALQNNNSVKNGGQIPFKLSKFYSFLNNALYIKLHVLRL